MLCHLARLGLPCSARLILEQARRIRSIRQYFQQLPTNGSLHKVACRLRDPVFLSHYCLQQGCGVRIHSRGQTPSFRRTSSAGGVSFRYRVCGGVLALADGLIDNQRDDLDGILGPVQYAQKAFHQL